MKTKTQRRKKPGLLKVGFLYLNRVVLLIAALFLFVFMMIGTITFFESANNSSQWMFLGGTALFGITALICFSYD